MTQLIIVGGGGHGAVVAETATASGSWPKIVFLDDNSSESHILDFPVIGKSSELGTFLNADTQVLVAVGNSKRRLELMSQVIHQGGSLTTVIHPTAWISPSAVIESGTVAFAGVVINARSRVGAGVILNTGATVDHDCVIGDGSHISPGANLAGGVAVGARTWIGIGAVVREGVTIGSDCVVGAGAAVISDVDSGQKVVGVPASPMRKA